MLLNPRLKQFGYDRHRGLMMPFGGDSPVVYLLRDEFTTTEAAPLASPRTCEPGPGTLTIVDTGNKFSISGGALVLPEMQVSTTDPRMFSTGIFSRTVGRTVLYAMQQVGASTWHLGWRATNTALPNSFSLSNQSNFSIRGESSNFTTTHTPANATNYQIALVNNSIGGLALIKGGIFTEWTLICPFKDSALAALANVYAGVGGGATANITVDSMRVFDLAAPFSTDYGPATNRVAVPGVGETTTSEADAIIEMTWTAVTGQTWNLYTRYTNDSNCWAIRLDQTGSTIKLIEINAGVETERASAAQTLNNGTNYRVVVIQVGNQITNWVNQSQKNNYASASFNNTVTGVKTDRAGTDLVAWPRVISGAALAELQRYTS